MIESGGRTGRHWLIARAPKYGDPVLQEYGVNPSNCYLFERRGQLPR
ncbi:MAG: hypothetical protein INH11_16595 [Gemmatimonas sp.]|nr:hypothetical protein [Gemmatimonas sp.]